MDECAGNSEEEGKSEEDNEKENPDEEMAEEEKEDEENDRELDAHAPPSIFVSLTKTHEIALRPLDSLPSSQSGDLQLPSLSSLPPRSGRIKPSSPMFAPGSLFRRLSQSRSSRSSRQSLDSAEESDQTDVFETPDPSSDPAPSLPLEESQAETFLLSLSVVSKKKIISLLYSCWVQDRPDERCLETSNTLLHLSTRLDNTKVLQCLLVLGAQLDLQNSAGDTALHLAVQRNQLTMVKYLVDSGADTEILNYSLQLNPLQCAALKLDEDCLKYLIKHGGAEYRVVSRKNQTILHLACLSIHIRLHEIRERLNKIEERVENGELSVDAGVATAGANSTSPSVGQDNSDFCFLESRVVSEEEVLARDSFPILKMLLKYFEYNPVTMGCQERLIELEDTLLTSPGTILHYFCAINHVEGVASLLGEPFLCDPNVRNKNHFTPILVAAKENNFAVMNLLLEAGADPNSQDPLSRMSPLHLVLGKYHINRRQETCTIIKNLISAGADPNLTNAGGEAPAHSVVQIQDIQMMACFLDVLTREEMNIKDYAGDSLLHYAASCMDEDAIFKIISAGANVMSRNKTCVYNDEELGFTELPPAGWRRPWGSRGDLRSPRGDLRGSRADLKTMEAQNSLLSQAGVNTARTPLQEALKNGNGQNSG